MTDPKPTELNFEGVFKSLAHNIGVEPERLKERSKSLTIRRQPGNWYMVLYDAGLMYSDRVTQVNAEMDEGTNVLKVYIRPEYLEGHLKALEDCEESIASRIIKQFKEKESTKFKNFRLQTLRDIASEDVYELFEWLSWRDEHLPYLES